mgnify:FL=1
MHSVRSLDFDACVGGMGHFDDLVARPPRHHCHQQLVPGTIPSAGCVGEHECRQERALKPPKDFPITLQDGRFFQARSRLSFHSVGGRNTLKSSIQHEAVIAETIEYVCVHGRLKTANNDSLRGGVHDLGTSGYGIKRKA